MSRVSTLFTSTLLLLRLLLLLLLLFPFLVIIFSASDLQTIYLHPLGHPIACQLITRFVCWPRSNQCIAFLCQFCYSSWLVYPALDAWFKGVLCFCNNTFIILIFQLTYLEFGKSIEVVGNVEHCKNVRYDFMAAVMVKTLLMVCLYVILWKIMYS